MIPGLAFGSKRECDIPKVKGTDREPRPRAMGNSTAEKRFQSIDLRLEEIVKLGNRVSARG